MDSQNATASGRSGSSGAENSTTSQPVEIRNIDDAIVEFSLHDSFQDIDKENPQDSPAANKTGQAVPASPKRPRWKRASRKNAPRRFPCDHPGCDKIYSRAEHLHRHQLNHNPKEIYRCDMPNCEQKFVRVDLLARHKKRHTSSYVPRNRESILKNGPSTEVGIDVEMGDDSENSRFLISPGSRQDSIRSHIQSGNGMSKSSLTLSHSPMRESSAGSHLPSATQSTWEAFPSLREPLSFGLKPSIVAINNPLNNPPPAPPSVFSLPSNSQAHKSTPLTPNTLRIQQQPQHSIPIPQLSSSQSHSIQPPSQPRPRQFEAPSPSLILPSDSLMPINQHNALPPINTSTHGPRSTSRNWQLQTQPSSDPFLHRKSQPRFSNNQLRNTLNTPDNLQGIIPMGTQQSLNNFDDFTKDTFSMWLFDSNMSQDLGMSTLPFGGGLESALNNNITYDYESSQAQSHVGSQSSPALSQPGQNGFTPVNRGIASKQGRSYGGQDDIGEERRRKLLNYFRQFYKSNTRRNDTLHHIMLEMDDGDIPALRHDVLQDFLRTYWSTVALRMPIIHQPTFSANSCSTLLLIVMIALGAASLSLWESNGVDYMMFSDMLIDGVRWEIMKSDGGSPPVSLWAAQALLLVEFYEKLFSVRKLHERAHIHHSTTLNLLRRGSPLIGGRSGSESPTEECRPSFDPDTKGSSSKHGDNIDPRAAWLRWTEKESMHRVVFTAFMFDIIHAAMFGHTADMQAHEIRLPLPCEDSIWSAQTPEEFRHMESRFHMCGAEKVTFLDGLRKTVHGQEVKSHSFARMIIMSGLLSVAYHIRRNSTQLRWLDPKNKGVVAPGNPGAGAVSPEMRNFQMMLNAFDIWKKNIDLDTRGVNDRPPGANGPVASASVLYHLAHVALHADIVDCQVYAGVRRLLGRKVSTRDYYNAVGRMKVWAREPATRHAILHAFKLLDHVLNIHYREKSSDGISTKVAEHYNIRDDLDPHRPWILYRATLSIWAFIRVYPVRHESTLQPHPPATVALLDKEAVLADKVTMVPLSKVQQGMDMSLYQQTCQYVARIAKLDEMTVETAEGLNVGVVGLLEVMEKILDEGRSELLAEVRDRLRICRAVLRRDLS